MKLETNHEAWKPVKFDFYNTMIPLSLSTVKLGPDKILDSANGRIEGIGAKFVMKPRNDSVKYEDANDEDSYPGELYFDMVCESDGLRKKEIKVNWRGYLQLTPLCQRIVSVYQEKKSFSTEIITRRIIFEKQCKGVLNIELEKAVGVEKKDDKEKKAHKDSEEVSYHEDQEHDVEENENFKEILV